MIAPTQQQLRILRLMAAGVALVPADRTQAHLVLGKKIAGIVRTGTVFKMRDNGWITHSLEAVRYELTAAGRAQAEVNTFVRAFADTPVSE